MIPPGARTGPDPSPRGPVPTRPRRRWAALGSFVLGLLLLGAAIRVAGERGQLSAAQAAARQAPWPVVAGVVTLPLLTWLLTSAVFGVLTRRYGRVGWGEMGALIGSASLLNLVPMRPGTIGRIAYHKVVNRLRVRDSAKVVALAMVCSAVSAIAMVAAVMLTLRVDPPLAPIGAVVPLPLLALGAAAAHRRRDPRAGPTSPVAPLLDWRFLVACSIRYAEVLVWALRYWLVFALVGRPIGFADAAIIAAASQASMLVPVQVGAREWIVGVVAGMLAAGSVGASTLSGALNAAAPGVTADLVNRAAELLVLVPVGLASTIWLWGRRAGAAPPGSGGAGMCDQNG